MLKSFVKNLVLVLVIVATLAISGFFVLRAMSPAADTRTRINSELLQSRIEQISELATLNYIYQRVGFFERYATGQMFGAEWRWPFTTNRAVLRYEGEIRFGIDVDRVAIDVDSLANRIVVSLPPARMLTHVIHHDTVELLDESTGLFANRSFTDFAEFIAHEQALQEEWLIASGILEQTRRNAESTILGLIEAIVEQLDEDYVIIFN